MSTGWSLQDAEAFWEERSAHGLLQNAVSARRQSQLLQRHEDRQQTEDNKRDCFVAEHRLQHAEGASIIHTEEAEHLAFWARFQSWTYCQRCGKLETRKLLPLFALKTANRHDTTCKCGNSTYSLPSMDDVPLVLRSLTPEDQRVLSPFEIHCGDYVRCFNGYRQRTGPSRVSWCTSLVTEKMSVIHDPARQQLLFNAYEFLMASAESSYRTFVSMQSRHQPNPNLYEIFTAPHYRGIECALWPLWYHRTDMCETVLEGQSNRASSKISFMHKVLSPVVDYCMTYDLLQFNYDRWLFKTITGAVNSSKASGCSPNRSLENKSFSRTFWQHQHLFLIDAVRQFGFPSFFITISPYEWTFPFPPFIDHLRDLYAKDVTDLPHAGDAAHSPHARADSKGLSYWRQHQQMESTRLWQLSASK